MKKSPKTRLLRRLNTEQLEQRTMLAGDCVQNLVNPEDVNFDGDVTAGDALSAINVVNDQGGSQRGFYADVTGDGEASPQDILVVINRVNAEIRGQRGSRVPRESRIERLEEAIESGNLPENVSVEQAQELLATLENGGLPELGDRFRGGQMMNISKGRESGLSDEERQELAEQIRTTIDGELPEFVNAEEVDNLLAAFEDGELRREIRHGGLGDLISLEPTTEELQEIAERVRETIADIDLPEQFSPERIDSLLTRLENGERPERPDRPGSPRFELSDEQRAEIVAGIRTALGDELPEFLNAERIEDLLTAFENGELREALQDGGLGSLVTREPTAEELQAIGGSLRAAAEGLDLPPRLDAVLASLENGELPVRPMGPERPERPELSDEQRTEIAETIRTAIDGELPEFVDATRVEELVTAFENGELRDVLREGGLDGVITREPTQEELQATAARLRELLDGVELPEQLDGEQIEAALAALENGDLPPLPGFLPFPGVDRFGPPQGRSGPGGPPAFRPELPSGEEIASRLREIIENGNLPPFISADQADLVLTSLENGETPDLGGLRLPLRFGPGLAQARDLLFGEME